MEQVVVKMEIKKKKHRALTTRELLMMQDDSYQFDDPVWIDALGDMQRTGIVLIQGVDKHGKTGFALLLAKMLQKYDKILYVCAEQKLDSDFRKSVSRANIDYRDNRIAWERYLSFEQITELLSRRNAPRVCFIDNLSMYSDCKKSELIELLEKNKRCLFVLICHQKGNEPDGALGRFARKLCMRFVQMDKLVACVGGRKSNKTFVVDINEAKLIHGEQIIE